MPSIGLKRLSPLSLIADMKLVWHPLVLIKLYLILLA